MTSDRSSSRFCDSAVATTLSRRFSSDRWVPTSWNADFPSSTKGEDLRFFFGEALGEESGTGVGEDFFFFFGEAEVLGPAFSVGVGLADVFFFFEEEGGGDFSGVAEGFGVGDFSASFFFDVVELWWCFRGAGVGVGAKIFLILLPNDSSD